MIPEYYSEKEIMDSYELLSTIHDEKIFKIYSDNGEEIFNQRRFDEFINLVDETYSVFFQISNLYGAYLKLDCLYCRLLEAKYKELYGISGTKFSDLECDPKCFLSKVFTETLDNSEQLLMEELHEHDKWLIAHPEAYLQNVETTWKNNQSLYHVKKHQPFTPMSESDKELLQRYYPSCLGEFVNKEFSEVNIIGSSIIESTKSSVSEALRTMKIFCRVSLIFDKPEMAWWSQNENADYFNEVHILNLLKGTKSCTSKKDGFNKKDTSITTIAKYLSCPVECVFMLMHYYDLGWSIQVMKKNTILMSMTGFRKLIRKNEGVKLRLVGYINRTDTSCQYQSPRYKEDRTVKTLENKPKTEDDLAVKDCVDRYKNKYSYFELYEVKNTFMDDPEKFNRAVEILETLDRDL